MRKTLSMLVMMSCMAVAQLASGQTQSTTDPAATKRTTSDINRATTLEAAPNATADPATANSTAAEKQTAKKAKGKKKNDTSNMQPDDPRKSPYWEPRDWTYIYNQGP
jgi:uncharacterized membrane protein